MPNAAAQVRQTAGARHERTLFAVACSRLLGGVEEYQNILSLSDQYLHPYSWNHKVTPRNFGRDLINKLSWCNGNEFRQQPVMVPVKMFGKRERIIPREFA